MWVYQVTSSSLFRSHHSFKMSTFKFFAFLLISSSSIEFNVGHPEKEVFWETPDFIINHGYPLETHTVVGLDGYILTYFRIPHGKYSRRRGGDVVIMRHAVGLSSRDWFVQEDPRNNLPFLLAEAGHDVWVANARGTKYSDKHISLTTEDLRYWDYSFHDIGTYDIPAAVDYVLRATGKPHLSYVGHSMGCTSLIVFLSQHPEYNSVLKKIVFMAPATYLEHCVSLVKLLRVIPSKKIQELQNKVAGGRVFPSWFTFLLRKIGHKVCTHIPGVSWKFCAWIVFLVIGKNFEGNSERTFGMISASLPQESSVKIVSHYLQWMGKPWMRQYDYGKKNNMIVYGAPEPPSYYPSSIRVPIMVMFGVNDVLTEAEDTIRATQEMENGHTFLVNDPKFNHLDFIYSWKAPELVYPYVVDFLR